jgi:peptidoglycan hydrolase-like protein with peptidoglycan-binding domain
VLIGAAAAAVAISGTVIVVMPGRPADPGQAHLTGVPPVISVQPVNHAGGVPGTAPIRLLVARGWQLSATPAAMLPRISPAVPGRWSQDGTQLTFTPATGFGPHIRVSISGPDWTTSYTTGSYSLLRLQQLLARLGYLPLTWNAAARPSNTAPALNTAPVPVPAPSAASAAPAPSGGGAAQLTAAYLPPAGQFSWRHGYPRLLRAFWQPGRPDLITAGAIMAFQSQHGMTMTGQVSPRLWSRVLTAAAAGEPDPQGYTYAVASKIYPETLTIWHDGRQVFRAYANTGIPVSPTADGTFPVYLRYRFQVMQGTNPDGSRYADPVQFVAYFHQGEAVHYFPRWSYGSEQSLGCVELPLGAAAQAWPYLTYGSLVTVTP